MSRSALAALALAFALAHLPFLPSTLEDIDSVNFALATREFDVSQHRPHPPGYPIYVGMVKAGVAVAEFFAGGADNRRDPSSRAAIEAYTMAVLSLVSSVVVIVLLYRLFACLGVAGEDRLTPPWRAFDARALAAAALATACPLFWYMAARPLSDMAGLAAALASQVALALAWWRQQPALGGDRRLDAVHLGSSGQMLVLGTLLAGVAIGVRSQTAALTLPLLLLVLIDRIGRGVGAALVGASFALAVGITIWAIPLLIASGGVNTYLAALGSQAGEDFAGVEMLYLNPSDARLAALALLRTFIYPWESYVLGTLVVMLAAVGSVALLLRNRRAFAVIAVITVPYVVFHLLFQDTEFTRYALPLMPPVAFLGVVGLENVARRAALPITGALALWAVALAAPVLAAYGSEASPTARALSAMRAVSASPATLAMHQTFRRPLEAETVVWPQLPSPPRREWLELVRYWSAGDTGVVWFLADPRRSDLALFDPASRRDHTNFAWRFSSLAGFGGLRPFGVTWYRMPSPGWFAEEGWALTPETAGIARLMGRGPHLAPITAWLRRRGEASRMMIGGRNLGAPTDPAAVFSVTIDGRQVARWESPPGFFLQWLDLPAGSLIGEGNRARLAVESRGVSGGAVPTAIEQFDVQPLGSLMWGYAEGWQEAEFNPRLGVWRWTSDRSVVRVVDASADVTISLRVESSLRYFDEPSTLKISVGPQLIDQRLLDEDAPWRVTVPLPALRAAGGMVTFETNQVFVPAERDGVSDRRRLGLRVFDMQVW